MTPRHALTLSLTLSTFLASACAPQLGDPVGYDEETASPDAGSDVDVMPEEPEDGDDDDVGEPQTFVVRANNAPRGLGIFDPTSATGQNLGLLPNGCLAVATGQETAEWLEIEYRGVTGWSRREALVIEEPDARDCQLDLLLPWDEGLGYRVTQGHDTGAHAGNGEWAWDFGLQRGDAVLAAHDGIVRKVKGDSTRGGCSSAFAADANFVVLSRGDAQESLYMHLDSTSVNVGDFVKRGQKIGEAGQTGWACGPHLHFQFQPEPQEVGASGYQPSVQAYFTDSGSELDPSSGSTPVSANTRPQ